MLNKSSCRSASSGQATALVNGWKRICALSATSTDIPSSCGEVCLTHGGYQRINRYTRSGGSFGRPGDARATGEVFHWLVQMEQLLADTARNT